MEASWQMEEGDDGVYVQSKVTSFTRDIPTGLGWLVGSFVTSIAKERFFSHSSARKELLRPEQEISPWRG
jgi:hypothetical protein